MRCCAERGTYASECEEQIGVRALVQNFDLASWGDDFEFEYVIGSEAIMSRDW